MGYQQKDGDAVIYKERDKRNERAPDWRGRALIDGVEYELAFWAKGDSGTMLAGNIKPAGQRQPSRGGGADTSRSDSFSGRGRYVEDPSDDTPFVTQWSLT